MGLGLTIGAIEIGVVLALFLTGTMTMQAIHYFRTYEDDSPSIRLLVAALCTVEIIHSALLANAVYYYTISSAGPRGGAASITLSMQVSMALIGPMQFAVRTWFCAVCIRRLTGGVVLTSKTPVWAVAKTPTFRGLAIAMFCLSAAADALIAAVICWHMWRLRSGLAAGDRLVDRLVRFTLCSGLLTSVGSVAEAVTYLTGRNFVFLAICVVVAKLFTISLLASLNDRRVLRDTLEGVHTLNWDKVDGHV